MSFQIEFKKSTEKDLKKIDKIFRDKIFTKTEELKNFPNISNLKKLSNLTDYFRLRVGDYRIIFQIFHQEKIIIIHYIRHRKIVYDVLGNLY